MGLNIIKRLVKTRGFKKEDIKEENGIVDALVLDSKKNKILIRVVIKSELKTNSIGKAQVQKMETAMKKKKVKKGILISNQFTSSATRFVCRDIEKKSEKIRKYVHFFIKPTPLEKNNTIFLKTHYNPKTPLPKRDNLYIYSTTDYRKRQTLQFIV